MKEKIKVLLPEAEVDKKIQELGEQISKDYEGKNIHMICVLKGGVFFTCELAKRISVPVSLDVRFQLWQWYDIIRCRSYCQGSG